MADNGANRIINLVFLPGPDRDNDVPTCGSDRLVANGNAGADELIKCLYLHKNSRSGDRSHQGRGPNLPWQDPEVELAPMGGSHG